MAESPILSRIRAGYARFSGAERKIAEYLLHESHNDGVFSISQAAARCGVSEASLVRFSKKLGYAGFLDFKRAFLNERLRRRPEQFPVYEELADDDDTPTVLRKVFLLMHESLESSARQVDPAAFEHAARWMARAGVIEFYAHGGSGCIVQSTVITYQRLGIRCTAHLDPLLQTSAAELVPATDVVFCVSHTGETGSVVAAARRARERGIKTIALTNTPGSPLARAAELVLLTAASSRRLSSDVGVSRVAQVAVLDALGVAVSRLIKRARRAQA